MTGLVMITIGQIICCGGLSVCSPKGPTASVDVVPPARGLSSKTAIPNIPVTMPTQLALRPASELARFFQSFLHRKDRMFLLAFVLGALALFIITRGKWR